MIVELTEAELFIAKYLGDMRNKAAKDNKIVNRKIGPQSDEESDYGGLCAELVYCKIHNLYPDLDFGHLPACDVMHGEWSVDIKYTKYWNGHLLVPLWKIEDHCDRYALVVGGPEVFEYVGYATAQEVFKDENIADFGYGKTYSLSQDELHKEM